MQFPDPPSSQTWTERILWLLGGGTVFTGLGALIKLILFRNKPKSEVAKLDADTEQTQAETTIKLSSQLIVLHDKINLLEASIETRHQESVQRQREHAESIQFYRKQILRFEELDLAYRNRSHALNGELGRLVLGIATLRLLYSEKTKEHPPTFEIRTYDEIIKPFPLPPSE